MRKEIVALIVFCLFLAACVTAYSVFIETGETTHLVEHSGKYNTFVVIEDKEGKPLETVLLPKRGEG